ncbi:unnamed protein product [Amaranthus hypochondriacus]
MEENLPPGFRFHPTDEELITFYLSKKVCNISFSSKAIAEVDLNKCEPWDLPAKASMGVKEWYFFSIRDRKYPTGLRTNRATDAGYWKTTGKDKQIYGSTELLIGMKKTLVFYLGRAPKGAKTNWVMHEYRLTNNNKPSFKSTKDEWVVSRVFQKNVALKKPQSSSPVSPDNTNTNTNTNTNEFEDISANNSYPLLQTYSNCDNNLNINGNTSLNLNNWATNITSFPSMSKPSTLLSTNLNNTINSLLLKALQFTSNSCTTSSTYFQPRDAMNTDYYSLLGDNQQRLQPLKSSSYLDFQSSSDADKLFDSSIPPQQNEVNQLQVQDQTFPLDSMW